MGKCCSSWKVREYDVGLGSKSIKKRLTYHLKDWNHSLSFKQEDTILQMNSLEAEKSGGYYNIVAIDHKRGK